MSIMIKSNNLQAIAPRASPLNDEVGAFDQTTDRSSNAKKMTIQLPERIARLLEELARTQGVTQVEAIRKAIATEAYLRRVTDQGGKVLIETEDVIKELVFR
jgi:transcriptional regulator of met regulon